MTMTTHRCGCVTEIEPVCGAQISVTKCSHHLAAQREIGALGEDYYRELGALNEGARQNYEREFVDGFGELPQAGGISDVLEIGGGASPYIPMFHSKGYRYFGIEPSTWACRWTMEMYRNQVHEMKAMVWENPLPSLCHPFDVILCAHALEHMHDAPAALKKMANHLLPGGTLYILVPDDTDLVNPDHLWFFNTTSLGKAMSLAGLAVESMQVRRRVPHENFIYCKARKPE